MKHYSHLSYNNLEEIQRKMNGLPIGEVSELNRGIKCQNCGKMNPLFVEVCDCGLPTEMTAHSGTYHALESEIEIRLEKKLNEFIESRLAYDRIMERFMNSLLEKSKRSPELLKAIGEIKTGLQNQHQGSCHN